MLFSGSVILYVLFADEERFFEDPSQFLQFVKGWFFKLRGSGEIKEQPVSGQDGIVVVFSP